MRYFIQLSYLGTPYCGWQRQPQSPSVQQTLEEALSTILRTTVVLTGCGRTDTGVHARDYYAHFDFPGEIPEAYLYRLNKMLPDSIALHRIFRVADDAHARYDARLRSYEYHLHFGKDPFLTGLSLQYPYSALPDFELMQSAVSLLIGFELFYPFCKSNSDVKTVECTLTEVRWVQDQEHRWVFHISANRFLRGMVRLIVGMSLNAGLGKVSLEEVKTAMETQRRLKKSWSVPPQGLFLTQIEYPFLE